MIFISDVILQNIPDAQFSLGGNDPSTLIWYETNIQEKPSIEQIEEWINQYPIKVKIKECESIAQKLLEESDWVDLYSNRNKLLNIEEWDMYRDTIRSLRINPVENPKFPDKPKAEWSN